jgi:hypothetical protein
MTQIVLFAFAAEKRCLAKKTSFCLFKKKLKAETIS